MMVFVKIIVYNYFSVILYKKENDEKSNFNSFAVLNLYIRLSLR